MEPLTPAEYEELPDDQKAEYVFNEEMRMYIHNPRADRFLWDLEDIEQITP